MTTIVAFYNKHTLHGEGGSDYAWEVGIIHIIL